jgi:hypothetical protein
MEIDHRLSAGVEVTKHKRDRLALDPKEAREIRCCPAAPLGPMRKGARRVHAVGGRIGCAGSAQAYNELMDPDIAMRDGREYEDHLRHSDYLPRANH